MTPGTPRTILEAFGLEAGSSACLIGGGGKTSLMFALARALAAGGRSVLTTTSTRIRRPDPTESDCVLIEPEGDTLIDRLRSELGRRRHVTVAASITEDGGKLAGLDVTLLDRLMDAAVADHVLVEADGAAGRSLKAHREHEPVLSSRADLVIVVIGVDCLGAPMDDRHVHRAALFRERLGRPEDAVVDAEDVAGIVFHPDGYLARIGRGSRVLVFLNKADTPAARAAARPLVAAMRRRDPAARVARYLVGDVRAAVFEEGMA